MEQYNLESLDNSVPSKWRVCAYFSDDEVVKILERQAVVENRSLSNLVATILMKAAKEFEEQQNQDSLGK
ncbi:MAG: hypothetical protein IGS48_21060 [Oscillatoriales cyanobacterium C42_A2020_001]|nr:hypothetical protein [Leptolyngbyaceae cyanobacterium C42_A2020_001]